MGAGRGKGGGVSGVWKGVDDLGKGGGSDLDQSGAGSDESALYGSVGTLHSLHIGADIIT